MIIPIEVRTAISKSSKRKPIVTVKGVAAVADKEHIYSVLKDKSGGVKREFKSVFTKNFFESMKKQMRHKRIFVDSMHDLAGEFNTKKAFESLKNSTTDPSLLEKISSAEQMVGMSKTMTELPMWKGVDFDVTDDNFVITVESNPFYAEKNSEYESNYDAHVGSVINGAINGISLNFKATKKVEIGGTEYIDDGVIFGVSLVSDAALGEDSAIKEVSCRSFTEKLEVRGMTEKTENEKVEESVKAAEELKKQNEELQKQLEEAKKAVEEREKKLSDATTTAVEAQTQAREEEKKRLEAELKAAQEKLSQPKVQKKAIVDNNSGDMSFADKEKVRKEIEAKLGEMSYNEHAALQKDTDAHINFVREDEYGPGPEGMLPQNRKVRYRPATTAEKEIRRNQLSDVPSSEINFSEL